MRSLNNEARIDLFPRVLRDIDGLTGFVSKYPGGDPRARLQDIQNAITNVARAPLQRPVRYKRASTGVELRRWNVRQFAIVYSYDEPSWDEPSGVVRIRAVRHGRVRNVFGWVREGEASMSNRLP